MWIRLQKELRELLPAGAQALGLALPLLVAGSMVGIPQLGALALGIFCAYLSSRPFGTEIELGTLRSLLSQPLSRRTIWGEKHLALALSLFLGVWLLLAVWRRLGQDGMGFLTWLFPLLALATGAGWSLVTRQPLLAMWLVVLVPGVLYLAATLLSGGSGIGVKWLLLPYGVGMAFWSHRHFRELELRGSTLPAVGSLAGHAGIRLPWAREKLAGKSATWQLWQKELRLQGSLWLLVLGAAAGWLALWLAAPHAGRQLAVGLSVGDAALLATVILGIFCLILGPLAIGANAVAAERRLGILGHQLSLPISVRRQWRIKLLATLLLTSSLTAVTLVGMGWFLHHGPHHLGWEPWDIRHSLASVALPLALVSLAAGVAASKHGRGPLHALGLAALFGPIAIYQILLAVFLLLSVLRLWPANFTFVFSLLAPVAPAAVAVVLLLRAPRQNDWLVGSSLRRSSRVLYLILILWIAQIALWHFVTGRLETETMDRNAKLESLGAPSANEALGLEQGLEQDLETYAGELFPLLEHAHDIFDAQSQRYQLSVESFLFFRITKAMSFAARSDGVNLDEGSYSRRFWSSSFMYEIKTHEDGIALQPNHRWQWRDTSFWRFLSLAPVYKREKREELLERRVRQDLALLAVELVRVIEEERVDDRLRQLVAESPVPWILHGERMDENSLIP